MSSVEKTFDQVANLVVNKRESASDGVSKAFAIGVRTAGIICAAAVVVMVAILGL